MVYRRRGTGVRRKTYGRGRKGAGSSQWLDRKYSVRDVASAAWKGVQYIKTLINSETHKLDTAISTTVSSTGAITHVSAIGQGDGLTQRTGNSVLCSYVAYKVRYAKHASATSSVVRCMILRDNQQVADTAPAVGDILDTGNVVAFYSAINAGRFQILSDRVHVMDAGCGIGVYASESITLNKHIRFNGSATTDIQKGGLYILLISNEATNVADVGMTVRIGWHDN